MAFLGTTGDSKPVRDGLDDLERDVKNRTTSRRRYYSHKHNSLSTSFVVTLRRHSLLLRDEKKGGFVNDDERWMHRYDDLCRFRERYGHTCVPFARTGSDAFMKDGVMSEEEVLSLYEEDDEEDDDDGPSPGDVNENEPDQHLELGYWVAQQRHYYKQRSLHGEYGIGRRLTPDRIDNLNKLGFIWDVKEARWEMQYLALQEFVLDHGHASVTHNSTLGHWCYKQRYHQRNIENGVTVDWACIPEEAYRPISSEVGRDYSILEEDWVIETAAGGKEYKDRPVSPLTAERRAKLDAIGFIWNVREQGWEGQFQSLCKYQQKYKTTKVPLSYGKLGVWVKKQREAWKHQLIHGYEYDMTGKCTSALTPERIEKLDSINFLWQGHDYTWEEHYQHLLRYKKEYGHVHVSQKYDVPEKYPKLGSWLTVQRSEGRKFEQNNGDESRLAKEKYDLLQRAGVEWDPLLSQFQSRVEQLRQYQSEYGTLRVKSVHKSLYSWVRRMTKEYESYVDVIENEKEVGEERKRSLLGDDVRRQMLDDLGFREELVRPKRDHLK
eukprot:CAMPEP_0201654290 /NCGR_PEP_ID=MMETSP0493-20130528/45421_1 /ASSEMBLY_ACC=CAM_ASM_000838 /TAXON_ID=420259 /ORGANISM="Thalassiosira gravida, Strain GMp14c1" /LENGTH=549 /DNA_ID=CAMNT_0048130843 /DNA_START=350 /DNA_END=2000 /DNA_ORIENTATION=+